MNRLAKSALALTFGVAITTGASASTSLVEFDQNGTPPVTDGGSPLPIILGGLVTYSDRTAFETDNPGLVFEDFEDATGVPGGLQGCGSPVDTNTNDTCFMPGDLPGGVAFSADPNATTGNLLIISAPFGAATSQGLITNTFIDQMVITFDPPVTAVGMDLISFLNGDTANVSALDAGSMLIGQTTASATNAEGSFLGLVSDAVPIARLEIDTVGDQAEGVDNFSFGTPIRAPRIIPTLDWRGLLLLVGVLGIIGTVVMRRRHTA